MSNGRRNFGPDRPTAPTLSLRELRDLRDIAAHLQAEDREFARQFTFSPGEPMALPDDNGPERRGRSGRAWWWLTRGRPLAALLIVLLAATVTASAAWLITSLPGPATSPSCAGPARPIDATTDRTMRVLGWMPASASCTVVSPKRGADNHGPGSGRAARVPHGEPVH